MTANLPLWAMVRPGQWRCPTTGIETRRTTGSMSPQWVIYRPDGTPVPGEYPTIIDARRVADSMRRHLTARQP